MLWNELPWPDIYDFLLLCGKKRDPKDLSTEFTKSIHELIPYDTARIYYYNDNLAFCGEALYGVDKQWPKVYHDYYAYVENGSYSIFNKQASRRGYGQKGVKVSCQDWTTRERDEFVADYIIPQGIRYTCGFSLRDPYGTRKAICMLDRTERSNYTEKEVAILNTVLPHIDNLFKNLYASVPNDSLGGEEAPRYPLTPREAEIAELLRKGISPANISAKLCISQTTVYKHITHIHAKMNVSNRQELMAKLANA